MRSTRLALVSPSLLAGLLAVAGCSDDLTAEGGPDAALGSDGGVPRIIETTDEGGGVFHTRVNASDMEAWVYMSFTDGSQVMPTTPETDLGWDVALQRYKIKVNGGVSGAGQGGMALGVGPFDALTTAPTEGFVTDTVDGDDDNTDPDWAMVQLGDWYDYDGASHTLSPKDVVFVIRRADGSAVKLQMLDYYDDAGSSGHPEFRWGQLSTP